MPGVGALLAVAAAFGVPLASAAGVAAKAKLRRPTHHVPSVFAQLGAKAAPGPSEEEMSVETALSWMPAQVSELYLTASTAGTDKALKALSETFERAQGEKDALEVKCKDDTERYAKLVTSERADLMSVESQLTLSNTRMFSLQTANDRSLAELEASREQYKSHKAICQTTREKTHVTLTHIAADLVPAKKLFEEHKACPPPALEMCKMPDASYVVRFKEAAKQATAAKLSSSSERLLSASLDRAIRGHMPPVQVSFLQMASRHRRGQRARSHKKRRGRRLAHAARRSRRGRRAHSHGRALRGHRGHHARTPVESLCIDATAPQCEAFTDEMATFWGSVQDLVDQTNERAGMEEEHCRLSLEGYQTKAKDMAAQSSDANIMMAQESSNKADLDEQREQKQAEFKDIAVEADHAVGACAERLHDLKSILCAAKKLRAEAEKKGSAKAADFMGDCQVTEWVRGPCTAECGGGMQNITREVISKTSTAKCPPLLLNKTCATSPCPIDGEMTGWGTWSECSRACGGGTRVRHREVLTRPEHGGLPLGETVQEELCNTRPCDADCELTMWTNWTNCSKACGGGHAERVRHVLYSAVGAGQCAAPESPDRRQARPCNPNPCAATPKCASKSDVVLALDSSGSVGSTGFASVKSFATMVAGQMQLGEALSSMGVVTFSSNAVVQQWSLDANAVKGAIGSLAWLKGSTNTAEAFVKADQLFVDGREGAPDILVVVTDGMPQSMYLASSALAKLKEKGVRVVVVAVGAGRTARHLKGWASWPTAENFIAVDSFKKLDQKRATELIANICPTLA